MISTEPITLQVLKVLQRHASYDLDQLAAECPDFSWNQIFLEVDRLNRLGELRLTPLGQGQYLLTLTKEGKLHGKRSLRKITSSS